MDYKRQAKRNYTKTKDGKNNNTFGCIFIVYSQ